MSIKNEQINFLDRRIFHPYWLWEDWKNGIYENNARKEKIEQSRLLLANSENFYMVMNHMLMKWPYSCEHNLTNGSRNRLAFLGQTACCWNHSATCNETIIAWWQLTTEQKKEANQTAKKFLQEYEQEILRKISL